MFSLEHIIWFIIMMALAITLGIYAGKKIDGNHAAHTKVLYIACGISVLTEIVRLFFFMSETDAGYYLPQENLPFNLCSIQIILLFILTFTRNEKMKNVLVAFMYPTMIGGAFMALLIPTSPANHGFFSIISFQYFIYHALLIFLSVYMITAKKVKFSIKNYLTALSILAGSLIFAIYLNSMFGNFNAEVNFFFVSRPPMEDLPILNMNYGWMVYILNLTWIAILLVTLCYIPAFINLIKGKFNKANRKHDNSTEVISEV